MALKGDVARRPREGPCNHHQQLLSTHCGPGQVLSLLPAFPHSVRAAALQGDASTFPLEATKAQRGDTQVCTGVRIQTKYTDPRSHALLHCLSLPPLQGPQGDKCPEEVKKS